MNLRSVEISGFKSFAKKTVFEFSTPIVAVVGPNGSGKSNVAESFRFALGEQSIKSLRGKRGEDLIFSGSQGAPSANRASVKITFDNKNRFLSIDYDEVVIERVVYRDGTNEYLLNNSAVRLKDIIELLAHANIGPSGHHIISQGEADRILSSQPKDRRAMIEDALGLKVFQYKKVESEKKLVKTKQNREQVEALRRENTPHLKFLERQVKKLERARELQTLLTDVYRDYLAREYNYLTKARALLEDALHIPLAKLKEVEKNITHARDAVASSTHHDEKSDELLRIEHERAELRKNKDEHYRLLGRSEGEIVALEGHIKKMKDAHTIDALVPLKKVEALASDITHAFDETDLHEPTLVEKAISRVKGMLADFVVMHRGAPLPDVTEEESLDERMRAHEVLKEKIHTIEKEELQLNKEYEDIRLRIESEKNEGREAEKEVFRLMAEETTIRAEIERLRREEQSLKRDHEEYEREVQEAIVLVGSSIRGFEDVRPKNSGGTEMSEEEIYKEARDEQIERRRELEKMKIRLEELGGADAEEILKEYAEVKERDDFLAKEIADLESAMTSLEALITDLSQKLDEKFKGGITTISKEFNNFFVRMFGGGSASLEVVKEVKRKRGEEEILMNSGSSEEEEEGSDGVEVNVTLPNKRIKGLQMLSGGERALTSIALIFAMSRVNPPPFLILDETDAALDEANSRRYSDMIEALSKDSQLILITHNRETMSRAGVLYGVTMGADGVSKLLSVKFEEGLQYAK